MNPPEEEEEEVVVLAVVEDEKKSLARLLFEAPLPAFVDDRPIIMPLPI